MVTAAFVCNAECHVPRRPLRPIPSLRPGTPHGLHLLNLAFWGVLQNGATRHWPRGSATRTTRLRKEQTLLQEEAPETNGKRLLAQCFQVGRLSIIHRLIPRNPMIRTFLRVIC